MSEMHKKATMNLDPSIETVAVYHPYAYLNKEVQQEDEIISKLTFLVKHFQHEIGKENVLHTNTPMCLHLLKNNFVSKESKNVRLWEACYIANTLKIHELESLSADQITSIVIFLMEELVYVKNKRANDPDFALCFYLLETTANTKLFNICLKQLKDPLEMLCYLFDLMFFIINEENLKIVQSSIVDVLGGLLFECGSVPIPKEILQIILKNIIEPEKLSNPISYNLAKELISRCVVILKPSFENFLNEVLVRQVDDSDLIYEVRCREVDCVREELNVIYASTSVINELVAIKEEYCYKIEQTDNETEEGEESLAGIADQDCDINVAEDDINTDLDKEKREKNFARKTMIETLSQIYIAAGDRMWNGVLNFKTLSVPTTFYSLTGRPNNIENLLNQETELLIKKKYCLNQVKAAVVERMKRSFVHEVFVSVSSLEDSFVNSVEGTPSPAKAQFSQLVAYLQNKQAAAIVNLGKDENPDPGVLSVLCAFPPCSFTSELLVKLCPDLEQSSHPWQGTKDYLVVVATYQLFLPMAHC